MVKTPWNCNCWIPPTCPDITLSRLHPPGLQILPAWQGQFNNPRGGKLGIITSAQMIGSLVAANGSPVSPFSLLLTTSIQSPNSYHTIHFRVLYFL
ncbi:hypothetical protein BC827DRAFT_366914 [Russula dissimulans]|nr:hypothetical protein BC827DRAFT_366914 [Russula dissimulans]